MTTPTTANAPTVLALSETFRVDSPSIVVSGVTPKGSAACSGMPTSRDSSETDISALCSRDGADAP